MFSSKITNHPRLIIALLMLSVLCISYLLFISLSLRLDESQTLWQTNRFPGGILEVVGQDVHVPLYHLSIHFWQLIFSNSIESVRMFSLLFFLLCIPLVYKLGKEIYGSERISILGSIIFSLSPFMNWYGNEARMYTLLVFIALINQYLFIKVRKDGSPHIWFVYTLTAILGVYTHYYFGLILVTQALFYLLYYPLFQKGSLVRFLLAGTTIGLALLPWILYVRSLGTMSNMQPLLHAPAVVDLFTTFVQYIFGTQSVALNSFIVALWPLVVLIWFLSIRKSSTQNVDSSYLILHIIIPILVTFIISILIRPVFEARYLIYIIPSLALILASTIDSFDTTLRRSLGGGMVVFLLLALVILSQNPKTPIKENFSGVTELLHLRATPSDIIIVSAPFTIYPLDYYYQGSTRIATLPIWNRYLEGPIPSLKPEDVEGQVKTLTKPYQRVWILLSYDQGYESSIRDYMNENYERLEEHNVSPRMTLSLYKLRYDTSNQFSTLSSLSY